jgi:hypothetical protein
MTTEIINYPMLRTEIAAVRAGVAPIPSHPRLMLTVLHLDAERTALEHEIQRLQTELENHVRACEAPHSLSDLVT